jgi:serine/threonine protein kinase
MEHPDGDSIGDYRLLKLLGQGAAGRVYLATSTREKAFAKPGDPLAVKVYKPEILERMHQLDRIRREFEVGSSVSHPHLIHMYENRGQADRGPRQRAPEGTPSPGGKWIQTKEEAGGVADEQTKGCPNET